ncbi:zf-HC2 domain-containing protein [Actinophytocola glycyrrhizae]|uniref:Zf-HC2 domain-containing protein n=1 Tax=Actinophytocola glycyrrhizae TaxID=2044873 RepID=A0ABV9RVM8_9PSEU
MTARESLSARLDGEAGPAPVELLDAHLAGCGACRDWQHRVEELNRLLRVRPAAPGPDLSATIVADVPVIEPAQGWGVRGALVCVAVAQVALGLSQLVGMGTTATHIGHGGGPAVAGHLFNESTAWNLALGIGMFWAAFRPRATSGLVPVLAGFVVVLFAYSTHDLITGAAPVSRVLGHGLLVIGLVLMIVVNRRHRPLAPEGARASGVSGSAHGTAENVTDPGGPGTATPPGRPHLRPAGRHHAA